MTLDFAYQRQRAMDDLLEAERAMRAKNESAIRDLQQVLTEIAVRLNGERFESMRRGDPNIPSAWSAAEWKTFFSQVSLPGRGWNAPELKFQREQREYLQQIEGLKTQIKALEMQLEKERAEKVNEPTTASLRRDIEPKTKTVPWPVKAMLGRDDDLTPPVDVLVNDVKSILNSLPEKVPAPFDKVLTGGYRTGKDLSQAIQRYWLMTYLIGRHRLSAFLEIDVIISRAVGLKAGAGSMHRAMEDLVSKNLVITETIKSAYTTLALYRLSPQGEHLYEAVFRAKSIEGEWERINRRHQGEQEAQHTMNMIAFAIHARIRGYSTCILPENKQTTTQPDLWIKRGDESLYIEVELSEKENPVKWKNQAALNDGKVAICAGTAKQHEILASDCKAMHLTGYATNLETLVAIAKDKKGFGFLDPDDPLWLEVW
jgi:hypothetical protein